jgi:hypothetical protein
MSRASIKQQQARRDKRAKTMLAVLGLVLLAVLGFEVPHYLKHHSSGTPVVAGTGTRVVSTTGAGGVAAAPGVTTAELQAAAEPQTGDLARFSDFAVKDPFRSHAGTTTVSNAGGSTTAGATTTSQKPATGTPTTSKTLTVATSAPKPAVPTTLVPAAVLIFDGRQATIVVGKAFPAKKPVFRLAAVGKSAMWISLVHGTFAGGVTLLKLQLGHPTTLVDSAGKVTFSLQLVRVTAKRVRLAAGATSTTTAATTTVTTGKTTTTAPPPPVTTTSGP